MNHEHQERIAVTTMTNNCAESVYDNSTSFGRLRDCERKAGFGPERKYCKQHAEKYEQGATVTWYQVNNSEYSFRITPIDVVKETETKLLIRAGDTNRTESKKSRYYIYFKTHAEAVEFYQQRVNGLLARAQKLQEAVNGMREGDKK
jgi:spore germination protein GerM